MTRKVNQQAGKSALDSQLTDISKLITAYYVETPDPFVPTQRVVFGTSGHRGSAFDKSFNEWHILAITQAICLYRIQQKINGPLFLGFDTHALSTPAFASTLEVLAANNIEVLISENDEYTPTPAISHAILAYNRGRTSGLADGIIITPSHNPPHCGGFKYNSTHGGPANYNTTHWIETKANEFLENKLQGIKKISFERARHASTTHKHDYVKNYVHDLKNVIDFNAIRGANIHLGVDPLGGAGIHYWHYIRDHYGLNLTVVNDTVDPTFRFMAVDWDGQIRMDPSSSYAMKKLIAQKERFDIAFACDTDHDRHGIVTKQSGLLLPNHYLCVAIYYLFNHRSAWSESAAIGKSVVTTHMINHIAAKLGKKLHEMPIGFKWFVDGLLDEKFGFCGEESAGASFLMQNGNVWTTDKDGILLALLSAEITARMERDLGEIYQEFEQEFGNHVYKRTEAPMTHEQKKTLTNLSAEQIKLTDLAGDKIEEILTKAPGNDENFGGIKVLSKSGWFAVRPSGTEDVYKIYAESFHGEKHLDQILSEAENFVIDILED